MIGALVVLAVASVQLDSVRVTIDLAGDTAHIHARYHESSTAPTSFIVMRRREQALTLRTPTRGVMHDTFPGLLTWTVVRRAMITEWIDLQYDVVGETDRLPLPVAEDPADPARTVIRITVLGVSSDLELQDAFPRFRATNTGHQLEARPSSLPSFVRLPRVRSGWSTIRGAETAVVAFVVFATAMWYLRRRTFVRRTASS